MKTQYVRVTGKLLLRGECVKWKEQALWDLMGPESRRGEGTNSRESGSLDQSPGTGLGEA